MQEFDRLFGLKRYIYHIICMTVPLKSSGNQCGNSCMFPLLAAGEAVVLKSKIPFFFFGKADVRGKFENIMDTIGTISYNPLRFHK